MLEEALMVEQVKLQQHLIKVPQVAKVDLYYMEVKAETTVEMVETDMNLAQLVLVEALAQENLENLVENYTLAAVEALVVEDST